MGSIVIFSCGHVFPKAEFFEVVLEEFKERLLKLRYTLPATLAMLLKEYHKGPDILCLSPLYTHVLRRRRYAKRSR